MKIAVSGKGGVGKTTLSALLCQSFTNAGYRVLAIDADPDANLAATLGFPEPEKITPIVDMKELISERTRVQPGSMGMIFKLNPKVDDIPEKFCVTHNGIRLLVMGLVKKAGTGCYCPENAFVRELIGHLLLDEKDVVIMDMEAGIEHLGRGTAGDVDASLVVVEPGKRSVETALRVVDMMLELGIKRYNVVCNRIRNEEDRVFVSRFFNKNVIAGFIPYSEVTAKSGREDTGVKIDDMTLIDFIKDKIMKGVMNG